MAEKKPSPETKPAAAKPKTAGVAMAKASNMKAVEKKLLRRFWNKTLPIDNKRTGDIILSLAKKYGLRPEALYASSYGEGMTNLEHVLEPDVSREVMGDGDYPVNGFFHLGVDTFDEAAPRLKKKGYLPEDFDYKSFPAMNEEGRDVRSGVFRTIGDGLMAKAAMYKDLQDQVQEVAMKKGVKLGQDEIEYLTMAGFNGGPGRIRQMVDEIVKSGGDAASFVKSGKTSLKQVHSNITPRMRFMGIMKEVLDEEKAAEGLRVATSIMNAPTAVRPGKMPLGSPLMAIMSSKIGGR